MKVLIADDNGDILDTTALILELEGHEVVKVQRASALLPTLLTELPDLVLQDANMPGFRLEQHLEEMATDARLRHIPVLIFSGQIPSKEAMAAPSVIGLLGKPFEFNNLRAWLDKVASMQ